MRLEDAIRRTQTETCRGDLRKYYRFRWARFYGGIATADCVGCYLRCLFCWSWDVVTRAERVGTFYRPEQAASKLVRIARRHHGHRLRISGNEPTMGRAHLIGVLQAIPPPYRFILETNGILLGLDQGYCRELAQLPNLHVRVSLKGCTPEEFRRLTGREETGFRLQIRSLENLLAEGVSCHAALMSFAGPQAVSALTGKLAAIDPRLAGVEEEELFPYPPVMERLHLSGLI